MVSIYLWLRSYHLFAISQLIELKLNDSRHLSHKKESILSTA